MAPPVRTSDRSCQTAGTSATETAAGAVSVDAVDFRFDFAGFGFGASDVPPVNYIQRTPLMLAAPVISDASFESERNSHPS